MTMQIHMLTLGPLATNCFIVADPQTLDAVIIDPADEADKILQIIRQENYTVQRILLTHAHFDHVMASKRVKAETKAPLYVHANEIGQLEHMQGIALMFGVHAKEPPAKHDATVDEGDIIEFGTIKLETYFTPGHSPGHVIFVSHDEKIVFGGDCVFRGSIGRTDFPAGNHQELMASIRDKILTLDDDYKLHVGHGPSTTVGRERRQNPFLLASL